nr:MAG TPA: zinc-ribbon family protein [Caudoviricetes sp.]
MPDCKACGKWFATMEQCELCPTCERALERLRNYAAQVVHGRWIKKWDLYDKGFYISRKEWYTCSNCGMKTNYKDESFEKEVGYNYCPNCGAKMDGGDGDAAD